jgi:hypothetical protein
MSLMGFEPMKFERAKTVHALDRTAIVIGTLPFYPIKKRVVRR